MFYRFIRICMIIVGVFLPVKAEGLEKLPKQGAYILACNHQSMLDIPVIIRKNRRTVHFMGKATLFNNKILGFLFRKMNCFPVVQNTSDLDSLRHAIKLLKAGNILGIFPQGHRKMESPVIKEGDMLNGFGLIALKTYVPIVPVAIVRRPRIFHSTAIVVGDAILTEKYRGVHITQDVLNELGDELRTKINALLPAEDKQ